MTAATLADVFAPARAVAGLVCLGWGDARAFVDAAETEDLPVILQCGPGARRHMPIASWGPMLRTLADAARVPVVVHLDHGENAATCRAAIDAGFTSVMYDGSRDPFAKNVDDTARIAEMAHAARVSCEGEIGFVGYADGPGSTGTDPVEAARFADQTSVDALAVSVGNVHLMTTGRVTLDWGRLGRIETATATPLVLHGGSGLAPDDQRRLARDTGVAKINIGTELRQTYGASLRQTLADDPDAFDRIAIEDRLRAPPGPSRA